MALMKYQPEKFWAIVHSCLVHFHRLGEQSAASLIHSFCTILLYDHQLEKTTIYAEEPFEVACALAGQYLDLNEYLVYYLLYLQSEVTE